MSAHLAKLNAYRAKMAAARAAVKDKAEAATQAGLTVAIAAGTAYAAGVVKGKFGPVQVAGIPVEALASGGLLAGAAFGAFGRYSNEAVAAAAGAACAYTHTMGAAHGAKLSGSKIFQKLSSVSGIGALPEAAVPSTAELDQLIEAAQRVA